MPEARARTIFAPRKLGTGFGSGIRKFEAGPKTSIPTFGSCSRSTRGNLPKQAGGSPPLRVVHVENASVLWVMRLHAQSSRLVTVHSVVRPANRHAFGNRTSWQSPGARPGPVRCSRPNIGGRRRKLTPATALLRVAHVETRVALRVRVENTRSAHLDAAASSRAMENSKRTSGHSANFPKQAGGSPLSDSRARKNCQRASGRAASYPELVLDDIAQRELGTCFGSGIRKFEAGMES